MDWRGKQFHYVRVRQGNHETIEPIAKTIKHGLYGKLQGERTIWSQPRNDDGSLIPVYYGTVPFLFRGNQPTTPKERVEYLLRPNLSAVQPAKDLINRLMDRGLINYGDVNIFVVMPDIYVEISAEAFGLKPDPIFPRLCHRVATKWGQDLGCDMSIYNDQATMPIFGTKFRVPFDSNTCVATYLSPKDFMDAPNHRYIKGLSYVRRRPNPMRRLDRRVAVKYNPSVHPLHESITGDIPPALQRALRAYHDEDMLETLCFSVGLAVKDNGGVEDDAIAWINAVPGIERLDKETRVRSVRNAFALPHRFGFRTFAKYFPEFAGDISEWKSPFFVFERKWLRRLLEENAPYYVHTVLYQLMADYYDYPQPWRAVPSIYPTGRRQAKALRILAEQMVISVRKNGRRKEEYNLNFNHAERRRNYVRLPIQYLRQAIAAKDGVRLLSQLLVSSTGQKSYRRVHMKRETIMKRLNVAQRTLEYHLKLLRDAGIRISPKLNIMFGFCGQDTQKNV